MIWDHIVEGSTPSLATSWPCLCQRQAILSGGTTTTRNGYRIRHDYQERLILQVCFGAGLDHDVREVLFWEL